MVIGITSYCLRERKLSHFISARCLTPTLSFRKLQQFVPHVLETNVRDFTVQLQLMLQEGVLALQPINTPKLPELALAADGLKARMLDVFALNGT
jgi:hypothetical protein